MPNHKSVHPEPNPPVVEHTEEVMTFLLRSGRSRSPLGEAQNQPPVLEVNQVWGDTLMDAQHFPTRAKSVTIGTATGYKWIFLGVEIGWVPRSMAAFLPYAPPMWSEVSTEWRTDFYSPDTALAGGNQHTLFEMDTSTPVAHVQANWGGYAERGGKRFSFEQLVATGGATKSGATYNIPIESDLRLVVDIEGCVYFAQMVKPGQRVVSNFVAGIDYLFAGLVALAAFIGLMLALLIVCLPQSGSLDSQGLNDRFVELILQIHSEKLVVTPKPLQQPSQPRGPEGAKAKKPEGKSGRKDNKMKEAKGNKVEMKIQQHDKQIAENAGLMGQLRKNGSSEGFGQAIDDNLLLGVGGVIGVKGAQIGSGGLGSRGSGLGNGGSADNIGGLGTRGIGSGSPDWGAGGTPSVKRQGSISRVGGESIIIGALTKSQIDQVVKRHLNSIRYCYQKELTKRPSLQGKVVVKFVIGKDGAVSRASKKSSTLGSSAVDGCVANKFKRMQFPEPKGGGIVVVSYPFLFASR